ncbi:MAG: hypothetical protein AAGJ80_01485, partial [Cyanobacteria bacterium J06553_1]
MQSKTVLKDTAPHIAGVRCGQALSPVVPQHVSADLRRSDDWDAKRPWDTASIRLLSRLNIEHASVALVKINAIAISGTK